MNLNIGDIIQFKNHHHWAECLAVVAEVKTWGVIADLRLPDGIAPIRVPNEDFDVVGHIKE